MVEKQSGDGKGKKNQVGHFSSRRSIPSFDHTHINLVQPRTLYANMGDNFRRRLEPIIEKLTKKGVRDGINLLKKAGSMDPLGEQQQWIQQRVDDPARMLARIDRLDQEDATMQVFDTAGLVTGRLY